jgi:hypothetical protein
LPYFLTYKLALSKANKKKLQKFCNLFFLFIIAYTINKKNMFTSIFSQRLLAYLRAEKTHTVTVVILYNQRYRFSEEIEVKAYTKRQARQKANEAVKSKLDLISISSKLKNKPTFY